MSGRWYVFMILKLFQTLPILNLYTLYPAHTLNYIVVLLLNHNVTWMCINAEFLSLFSLSESYTQLGSEEISRASQKLLQRNHLIISQASNH